MKITSLEPQKKRKSRLNLYIDGEFKCGIDSGTAASLGLFEGKEIDDKTLSSLADEESYQLCLDRAFLLLSIRIQAEHELWEKLGKKFFKKDISKTIARLKELGYVDDSKFAKLWLENRLRNRGPNVIRTELARKGIKRDIIDETLTTYGKEKQLEIALQLISTKDRSEYTKEERFKKLAGLLSRKGFSYDVIKKALND